MNDLKEIFGIKIPPPVEDKIGVSESFFDTLLLAIFIILAFLWGALWFAIWVVIAIPLYVLLLAVCYFVELITLPFRRY